MHWSCQEDADHLKRDHKLRLGFMLNYSVFLFQNMMKIEEARSVAKRAFDEALVELPQMSKYKQE